MRPRSRPTSPPLPRRSVGIDILVCNASGFGTTDDEAGWQRSIDIDLLGTARTLRAALPFLEQSAAGAIVNISSISGIGTSARTPPYGAVKAAIMSYTQSEAAVPAKAGTAALSNIEEGGFVLALHDDVEAVERRAAACLAAGHQGLAHPFVLDRGQ
jgi:NAD(P)-dependent dehydrogenase (short-subunit alcohol dehydrogenase family)